MRLVRGFFAWVVVVSTLLTGSAAITPAEERTCLPSGGHPFTLESDTSTLTVTAHASLYAEADEAGALGLAVDGVSHDRTTLVYRTGVVREADGGFTFAFDAGARFPTEGSEHAIDVDQGRVDDTIDTNC